MLTSVRGVKLGQEAQAWPGWPESKGRDGGWPAAGPLEVLGGAGFQPSASLTSFGALASGPSTTGNGANTNAKPRVGDDMERRSRWGPHGGWAWLERRGWAASVIPITFAGGWHYMRL